MKRYLALCLALLLVLSACPIAQAADSPVPITMFYPSTRPMNELTELTRKYVQDNLGIDMQLTQGSEDWKQQLALYVTSGDIPDLVSFMDLVTFDSYAKDGVFCDLTDKIQNYPNILEYVGGMETLNKLAIDGHIYGIPSVTPARSYYVTNIRTDWLKKLGLETPKTLDEFTNVIRAFTKNDPDGNGTDDTYGFSGYGYEYLTGFFGAFGATPQQDYFLNNKNKVTTNVISAEYKAALEYLRGIYAEGLIDPELFTADYAQTQEKWVRGQMGIWTSWWSGAGNSIARFGFLDTNPSGEINVIQPPVGSDSKSGVIGQNPIESVMGIAYDSEHVDDVLKLIDFACSNYGHKVMLYGIEGQFFENDADGKMTWNYTVEGKDKQGNAVTDMQVYRFFYNIPVENEGRSLVDTPAQRLYLESIGVYTSCSTYPNLFMGLMTDEYGQLNSELTAYVKEMGIKFILGDASLDKDWDSYISTYLKMGGETVRQSLLNAYNAKNGTTYTFAQ